MLILSINKNNNILYFALLIILNAHQQKRNIFILIKLWNQFDMINISKQSLFFYFQKRGRQTEHQALAFFSTEIKSN